MKKYVGTKVVEARPMTRGDYNNYRGWQIPVDENPEDAGYLVKHSDSYVSWSPAYAFEAAYREYDKNKLLVTAVDMMSEDYKERFKAEYKQLEIRFDGLRNGMRERLPLNLLARAAPTICSLKLWQIIWRYLKREQ